VDICGSFSNVMTYPHQVRRDCSAKLFGVSGFSGPIHNSDDTISPTTDNLSLRDLRGVVLGISSSPLGD